VGGVLMEEKIYSQISTISAGDIDSLMSMYTNMDYCMSQTGKQLNFKSQNILLRLD
jgi:hypothetical protein